ncbi:winged helix-turn-helix domain-containing protein [Streptomyces sp900105755]|uniref:Winged helix-turn-helix domain-containing protein n=1 Tax=Streptomyces sp. 900105755 TaxID=3154389 RepID=A0ABV1TT26_9ACTN
MVAEAEPGAVRATGGGAGRGAGRARLGGSALDTGADQVGDRSALPHGLHDPGRAELLARNGWSWQVPARRAMERDDEAVAGWVKEVWRCAEDSRRPVEPGSSSRTKPDSP